MADHYSLCIIAVMDRLWFHQIVLFSRPTTALLISESQSCPSLPHPSDSDGQDVSRDEPQVSSDSISITLQDDSKKAEENGERPRKRDLLGNKIRSQSSSPFTPNYCLRKFRKLATARRLQKSISYRTLGELELEEVKGFMDLGFVFKKESVSPRMMNVVPGLQRFGMCQNKQNLELMDARKTVEDGDVVKMKEKRDISIKRPYLSEAWLIKKPDSQLLNLKIPMLCSASDMKKHLRFWAKTVASEILQQ